MFYTFVVKVDYVLFKDNEKIRKFPANIFAGMFGFEEKEYFEAKDSSNNVPEVSFE